MKAKLYYGKNLIYKVSRLDLRIYVDSSSSYYRIILIHRYHRKKVSNINKIIKNKTLLCSVLVSGTSYKREKKTKTFLRDCQELDYKLLQEKLKNYSGSLNTKKLIKLIDELDNKVI